MAATNLWALLLLLGLTLSTGWKHLEVSEPQRVINGMNPVEKLLHRTPLTVAEFFADQLMEHMRTIREHCEEMETQEERKFEGELKKISEYQEQVNNLLNNKYGDIPEEEKEAIRKGFEIAFKNLFKDEQSMEKAISLNCTLEFEAIMNQKMSEAVQYAETLLNAGTTAFVSLINGVIKYSQEMQTALDQCLDLFPADDNTLPLRKGSPSYKCKQVEIQILMQFVYEFIIRSTKLLSSEQDTEDILNILGPLPSNLPEVFPRPEVTSTEEPTIELVKIAEVKKTDEQDTSEITQPHPSKSSTNHHNEATNSKHTDSIVTESPAEHGHFDIIIEPEESLSNVHKQKGSTHQSYYILLTCGVISGVLFLLIVVTGVLILTVKCRRSQRKSWSQLTEEEKVSAMKQSGYINPTYEFFDKVAQ